MKIVKSGTLRFWGDWFGRPYDNYHIAVAADYDKSKAVLVIRFGRGEKCTVYNPIDLVNLKNDFHISKATKIIWEWYSYGEKQIPQNLCKIIYSQTKEGILKEYSDNIRYPEKIMDWQTHYALEIC